MTIYSFDGVLRRRRTMHSFEVLPRQRVPLPRPVPMIAFAYFAVVLVAVMAADNVVPASSGVGSVFSVVAGGDASIAAVVVVYAVVPAAIVWAAMNVEIDGRSPHYWVVSVARFVVRPKRRFAGVSVGRLGRRYAYGGRVRFWWDERAPRLHHGWISGGSFSTSVGVRFTHALRHRSVVVRPDDDGDQASDYEANGRVEVLP